MAEELVMNIKSNIKSVTKETDELGESIGKATDETKGLGSGLATAGASGKKGFDLISSAVYGLGVAIKALGVGLLVSLFMSLKEALERNQKVMNVVNTILSTTSTTFNQVANVLTDVVKWVTESTDRFNGLGKVMSGIGTLVLTPFKAAFLQIKLAILGVQLAWANSPFGGKGKDLAKIAELRASISETGKGLVEVGVAALNAGKDIVSNFGDAVGEIGAMGKMAIDGISDISIKANIELAKATTAAVNSSKLAEVAIQGLIEKYDRQAELQRNIRDDERKTFAERIEANKKLGEILNEQEQEMLKLADNRIAAAALELSANKENVELQVAYQQALNDSEGVKAQVAGFRSEQLQNEMTLEKELGEVQNEVLLARLSGIDLELAELARSYELQLQMAEKAGMDTAAITEQYEKEKSDIKERYQKESIKKERKKGLNELKWAEMNKDQKLDVATQAVDGLAQIAGEETEAGKALAVASATMNTYSAATAALAPPPVGAGPILGPVFAGVAIATGLSNIQKILSSGGGGGAAAGGANISAPPTSSEAPPAPQMMSGEFSLGGGVEPEPLKAFVVTDEMTSSQDQLANIRRRATI